MPRFTIRIIFSLRLVIGPLALIIVPTTLVAQRAACDRSTASSCVRPFITDDARVVGAGLAQIESWTRVDRETSQLWMLGAVGPNAWLELTAGGVLGVERDAVAAKDPSPGRLTYALPLLQAKALVRGYEAGQGPGLAVVGGTFLPGGRGFLQLPGYGTFGFAILSQALTSAWEPTERAPDPPLLHANVGVNRLWIGDAPDETVATWGIGTQFHVRAGAHVVAELFSGDPYVPGSGTAWQAGVRQFLSERLQLDATVGRGVAGDNPLPVWWSAGVRWVLDVGAPTKHARSVRR
jgi:hypothetical protein